MIKALSSLSVKKWVDFIASEVIAFYSMKFLRLPIIAIVTCAIWTAQGFASSEKPFNIYLYKKVRTHLLSVKSNVKVGKVNNMPTIYLNTHGVSLYAVDIKDGILVFFPTLKYRKSIRKTFTDVIGYVVSDESPTGWLFVTTVSGEILYFGKSRENNWTKKIETSIFSPPVAFDYNGDGKVELAFGDDRGSFHIFSQDGKELITVSKRIRGMITSGAVFDRDSKLIFVGASNGKLYAISTTGAVQWFASAPSEIFAGPVLGDINGDGHNEVIVTTLNGGVFILYPEKRRFKHLFQANFWIEAGPALADLDGDGKPEILVGSWDDYLYALDEDGTLLWKFNTGADVRTTPVVADLNGDGTTEIILTTNTGKLYILSHSGKVLYENKLETPALYQASVLDLDGDEALEIAVTSATKMFFIFKTNSYGKCEWPLYRNDLFNSGVYKGASKENCPR